MSVCSQCERDVLIQHAHCTPPHFLTNRQFQDKQHQNKEFLLAMRQLLKTMAHHHPLHCACTAQAAPETAFPIAQDLPCLGATCCPLYCTSSHTAS